MADGTSKIQNSESEYGEDADMKNADDYVGPMEESDQSIYESSEGAFKKITKSVYNLATYKSAEVAVNIFDSLSLMTLGMQEISDTSRDEIVNKLKKKRDLLLELSKDPELQELVRETSMSVTDMLTIFIETSRDPVMKLSKETFDIMSEAVLDSLGEMMNFGKNLVKIIPGLGDAYIIVDNVLSTGKVATGMLNDNAKLVGKFTSIGTDISAKLATNMTKQTSDMIDHMGKFKRIQNRLSKKIEDTGELVAKSIFPYEEAKEKDQDPDPSNDPEKAQSKEKDQDQSKEKLSNTSGPPGSRWIQRKDANRNNRSYWQNSVSQEKTYVRPEVMEIPAVQEQEQGKKGGNRKHKSRRYRSKRKTHKGILKRGKMRRKTNKRAKIVRFESDDLYT